MWTPLLLAAAALAGPPVDAVVLVEQGRSTCAGAIVAGGRVATAYHCVAAGGRPRITTRDGTVVVGRVVGVRRDADLAVIDAPGLAGLPGVALADEAPPPGSDVFAIGHPFGIREPLGFMEGTLRWSVASGVVSAVGPRAVQVDAPLNPGNSGGPILDADGRLIGVVSRKSAGGEGLGFAGRVEILAALIEEVDDEPRALSPFGGTVTVGSMVSALADAGGAITVAPRVELALRDRVVVSGTWGVPISARWDAVRLGESRWIGPEARLGLRQRLFRGAWTTHLDGFVGVGGVTTLQGSVDDGAVRLTRAVEPVPLAGGQLVVGSAGFELAWTSDGAARASLVLRWPGVRSVL